MGEGESVLETLVRHGVSVPSSCRSGMCQACLFRTVAGEPGAAAQEPLKDTLRVQGYFLGCLCRPQTDLTVVLPGDEASVRASLASMRRIGRDVLQVHLRPERPFPFRAGQYVTVLHPDGPARPYSIANLPEEAADSGLELHVRLLPGGVLSGWLARAHPGTPVRLRGPNGDCCYLPGRPDLPLVLAGTGTGMAPLRAVLRDALRHGHRGATAVIYGAREPSGLYLHREFERLARAYPTVRYQPCVLRAEPETPYARTGDVVDVTVEELDRLVGGAPGSAPRDATEVRAFLCGAPGSVRRLRRALFLAGLSLRDIHADEFLPAAPGA